MRLQRWVVLAAIVSAIVLANIGLWLIYGEGKVNLSIVFNCISLVAIGMIASLSFKRGWHKDEERD